MSLRPTVAQVRKVRPFKMGDTALDGYIDLAETSPFAFQTLSTITSDTERTHLWALMAAHLATMMAEPEPTSTRLGSLGVTWADRRGKGTPEMEALKETGPGREFATRWFRYNVGRVLR